MAKQEKPSLSETEQKAFDFIKNAQQPLAIRDMPHQFQGTIGKLTKYGLIETYKTQVKVSRHGFDSMKSTSCVRVKENVE